MHDSYIFHYPKCNFLHLEGPIFGCSHANHANHASHFNHNANEVA